jgi:polar amino acid transport system substrate-binding protein
MNRYARRLAGVLLALALAGSAVAAGRLRLLTEESPPNNFVQNGKLTGLSVEVAQEIMRRLGSTQPIELMPWARAYRIATDPSAGSVALFMMGRTPEREPLFQWVGPLATSITAFYGRSSGAPQILSLADARALPNILVPREWFSYRMLAELGFANLEPVDTPEMMMRMVMKGRAPVFVISNGMLPPLANKVGAQEGDFRPLYELSKTQGHLAFSLATPPEVVRSWQQALDEMKRDGTFLRIFKRWYPTLPPPGLRPEPAIMP